MTCRGPPPRVSVKSPHSNPSRADGVGDLLLALATALCGPAMALAYFCHRHGQQAGLAKTAAAAFALTAAGATTVVLIAAIGGRARMAGVGYATAALVFWSMAWHNGGTASSIGLWLTLSTVLAIALWRILRIRAVNLAVVGYCVVIAGVSVSGPVEHLVTSWTSIEPTDTPAAMASRERPLNVYLIVVEDFGRLDVLDHVLDGVPTWSQAEVSSYFERFNMVIDDRATANYGETTLSMAAVLSGELRLDDSTSTVGFERSQGLQMLAGRNRLVTWFAERGYEYWHASSGLIEGSACEQSIADRCFGSGDGGEAQQALFDMTPLRGRYGSAAQAGEPGRLEPADFGRWASQRTTTPKFVYAHFVNPHPPYSRHCLSTFGIEADDVGSIADGWSREHKPMYAAQVRCLAAALEEMIARIVAADPDGIVVVQSDHGPAFDIGWDPLQAWTSGDIWQRFGAFRATRMPPECLTSDPAASSLVNTKALLTACLDGTEPVLIEPASYLTLYGADSVELINNTTDGVLATLELPTRSGEP